MADKKQTAEKLVRLLPNVRSLMNMDGMLGSGEMISSVQLSALIVLWTSGPQNMTTLARKLGSSKPNLTMLVDRMERVGLVMRTRSLEDRRVTHISITEKAEQYLQNTVTMFVNWLQERMAGLEDADVEALDQALDTLLALVPKFIDADK